MQDDLISRQAAINLVQEDKIKLVEPYLSIYKSTGCIKEAETQAMTCDRHVEMIRKMPSVNVVTTCYDSNLWTPSSEGLPKDDDWKIVTIKDESGDYPFLYTDFGWYLDAAKCWIIDAEQRTDVIAWADLPNPYAINKKVCAADVVERKKGEWKLRKNESKHQDWWACSECGGQFSYKWNFCPYCGADMRGENNE